MKKKFILFITLLISAALIAACGSEEEEVVDAVDEDETAAEEEETGEPEEEVEEENEEAQEEPAEETTDDGHFAEIIAFMEEETQGTATVLYENTDTQTHEMEGVNVSLDAYALVELLDFHANFGAWFDDQTDGAVILSQYTITNDTDEDLYYTPNYLMSYTGADEEIVTYNSLLPEEKQIPNILADSEEFWLEAGDEFNRYYAYPLGEDRLEEVLNAGNIEVEITTPQTDPDDPSSVIGSDTIFTLPLDGNSPDSE
jgi:cobalamin biosynthesis protein CobT